jgi:hypothetical protein
MATWRTIHEASIETGRSAESLRRLVNRHRREVKRRDVGEGRRVEIDFDDLAKLLREVGR